MIPYGKQSIDEEDIEAVVRALRSDYLTTGPEVEAFEREFAEFVGAKHAVAVCNATAALHLAMRVADIGPGDRVVTSPNTFLASANCAAYVGAIPDFADIDPVSYNLCPESLEQNWQPDTKAVVAVDYAGQPANLPAIAKVARDRGAVVIEDGCHGVGGGFYFNGQFWKIGGHPWADMTTFSFHPVKTMTTGEGGMLVTDNDEYARLARLLRSHGMERDPDRFLRFVQKRMENGKAKIENETSSAVSNSHSSISHLQSSISDLPSSIFSPGPWVYEMQELGYNYRITDLQCALGRSQLKKLSGFIARRREIVARYNEAFGELDWLTTPGLANEGREDGFSLHSEQISWHLYTVQIDFSAIGNSRTEVMHDLRHASIGTQVLYIPVHLQPWYQKTFGYAVGKCPQAESYYTRTLSLPLYPAMRDAEVEQVIDILQNLELRK